MSHHRSEFDYVSHSRAPTHYSTSFGDTLRDEYMLVRRLRFACCRLDSVLLEPV